MLAFEFLATIKDGKIEIPREYQQTLGRRVRVIVLLEPQIENGNKVVGAADSKAVSGSELLESGLVGIWADREEIADSVDFARQLREEASRRYR
jgi:hypothetical protein